jgi:2-polyprenyl-3-methyl-5-hydroxy-6-metoxy-1,4-benzoquinol methylase
MVDEVQKLCVPGSGVLDFGSGEEAALCQLLSKKGINCYAYDPLFCKNLQDNGSGFDIIILCEVIEHIRDIRAELELINKHLSEDGKVILRTQTCGDITKFAGWWYAQDLTHINFFNQKSLKAAAGLLNKRLCRTEHSDIFVLR